MKKNKFFKTYSGYRIRIFKHGRKLKYFFKIVVVDSDNKIVENLGYIMSHPSKPKNIKPIGLNKDLTIKWITMNARPSFFVFFLFESLGLIKYESKFLKKF